MASLADVLVRQLLDGRHIASLATENPDGSIHMSKVIFENEFVRVPLTDKSPIRKMSQPEGVGSPGDWPNHLALPCSRKTGRRRHGRGL